MKWGLLFLLLILGMVRGGCNMPMRVTGYWLLADSSKAGQPITNNQQLITNNQQPITPSTTPRFSLKNGTLSLFDPYTPSFNIAVEHIMLPRLYGHLEAGPLFNLRLFPQPVIDNLKGYRLRGAVRYYLRPLKIGTHAPFVELMYTQQYTDADIEGDFRRSNALGWYQQRLVYHTERREHGGYINMGLQQAYAGRFIFEFGFGLGISRRRASFSGVPPDAAFSTNGSPGWEYDPAPIVRNMPAGQVYINLGYVLW